MSVREKFARATLHLILYINVEKQPLKFCLGEDEGRPHKRAQLVSAM